MERQSYRFSKPSRFRCFQEGRANNRRLLVSTSTRNALRENSRKSIKMEFTKKFGYNIKQSGSQGILGVSRKKLMDEVNQQSEAIIKNSLMYRKLEVQYEGAIRHFDKQSTILDNYRVQLQRDVKKQKQELSKLNRKKLALQQLFHSLQNKLVEIEAHNYELQWDLCEREQVEEEDQYENLLELEERVGKVSFGLGSRIIKLIKQKRETKISSSKQLNEKCCICCEGFHRQERTIRLQCSHQFHSNCILQWLQINKVCPLCRDQVKG